MPVVKTSLPPQYDPAAVEAAVYRRWLDAGVFTADAASTRAPYVIVMPPPNITDILHMGHGLNNALQDVLIRFERMRGREVLWLPGTDHAAIATQNVVERQLAKEGTSRQAVGREAFLQRVERYQQEKGGIILDQLKALGASCDWTRTRFTMDPQYSRSVRHTFVALYQDQLIYRGHRVIHWCPRCLTSLSDEEAEFQETDGKLYHVRYPMARTGASAVSDAHAAVVVATSRPETMFGDVAVVYHPGDQRYHGLDGQTVQIPLSGTVIPVKTHPAVERDFGTGMLKVTPAHDANDFEIAGGLQTPPTSSGPDAPVILTEDGRMADVPRVPVEFRGLDRFEARKRIVQRLEAAGHLAKVEAHRHAVRHCYRCRTVVEPRLSDQWFVRMKPMADRALAEYRRGRLRLIPERWGAVYQRWLSEIRDWNISRQIWFGHRIPAWYCDGGHITVAEVDPSACGTCGRPVRQDDDVLDTWFSSGLWPFATLGWPEHTRDLERFYPGHTLVTGPDIIFFWVARMVMLGYHFNGERPFETVLLNGIVRDAQHRRMSKSVGNGIDPVQVISAYGADALRFTVVAAAPVGTDIILDHQDLETTFAPGRNFANKLWNAGRFILSHVDGASPPAPDHLTGPELADRWVLSRCQRVVAAVTEACERFRVNDAATEIYQFVWHDLADWYVEQVKPRLTGSRPGGDVARRILAQVFETALRLLHPVMPFVTEELWQHLPRRADRTDHAGLLAQAAWPAADPGLIDPEAEQRFAQVQALVKAVRAIRAEYGVDPGRSVRAAVEPVSPAASAAFAAERQTIEHLAKISRLAINGAQPVEVGAHAVLDDGSTVFVPMGDAIDVARECDRLGREGERLERQLEGLAAKLANPQFVSRAPAEVVERERAKESAWREQHQALAAKLRSLGCKDGR